MDKLTHYKELIKEVVTEWAETGQSATAVETVVSFDDAHENYLMVSAGWHHKERHHNIIFHARVKEGKVWIEWDGTFPSISEELIRRGMAEKDIVFDWQSPSVRALKAAQEAAPA